MTHRLMRFGTVDLPLSAPQFDAGTAASRTGYVQTADGSVYDARGTERADAQYPYTIAYRADVVGASLSTIRTTIDALRALRGKRQKLYRMMLSDGTSQWAYARLDRIAAPRDVRNVYFQGLELAFSVLTVWHTSWHGLGWTFDDGEELDTGLYLDMDDTHTLDVSPKTISLSNGGTAEVTELIVTVTAGSADITALTLAIGDCEVEFTGTISSGTSLVIDSGVCTILNAGADAWSSFDTTANHASKRWLVIPAGGGSLTVTFTGGDTDSTITCDYWEAHE